jgi:2-isopropylmalate synthase
VLKKGIPVLSPDRLATLSDVARAITAISAKPAVDAAPYVGVSAFAHKAGLHASALRVDASLYQHINPGLVGNTRRTLVSDMAGRASIELKAKELGYRLAAGSDVVGRITERVKVLESQGYAYESADASFELLLREELRDGSVNRPFEVESWHLAVRQTAPDAPVLNRAQVTVRVGDTRRVATGEGNGPINALDRALRAALRESFSQLDRLQLHDYRVRILEGTAGSDAATRVVATFSDGVRHWKTVGVNEGVVAASWCALLDAFRYAVLRGGPDSDATSVNAARAESDALSRIGASHVRA